MKKILIFQDFAPHLATLSAFLRSNGHACLYLVDARDLSNQISDDVVAVCAPFQIKGKPSTEFFEDLSIAHDQILFFVHRLGENDGGQSHGRVFWNRDLKKYPFEIAARLLPHLDLTVEAFKSFLSAQQKRQQETSKEDPFENRSKRFEARVPATLIVRDQEHSAQLVNLSGTGALVLCALNILKDQTYLLRFQVGDGQGEVKVVELNLKQVRAHPLKSKLDDFTHAVAGTFVDPNPVEIEMVVKYFQNQDTVNSVSLKPHDLPFVFETINASWKSLVKEVFDWENRDARLRWIGEITRFEFEALKQKQKYSFAVVQGIVLRAKVGLLIDASKTVSDLGPQDPQVDRFVPGLTSTLSDLESVEVEIEGLVKQCVEDGNLELQQSLNHVANQLHHLRMELYQKMAEYFEGEAWEKRIPNLSQYIEISESYRQVRSSDDNVRFKRRKREEDKQKKKELPKEERDIEKKVKQKQLWRLKVAASCFILFLVGQFFYEFVLSRVAPDSLGLTFEVSAIRKNEDGLDVTISPETWRAFGQERKDEAFSKVEKYLEKTNQTQVKFIDESGEKIAATVVLRRRNDGSAEFGRREFPPR